VNVKVQVELSASPLESDKEEMHGAAWHLTNNKESVVVYALDDKLNTIVAEFTINKARQMDVVDRIAREFKFRVSHYGQSIISFPAASSRGTLKSKSRYTRKQGQYLAFIYYYTKLNGYPPAEADMQRYFKTTPPAIHGMAVQLEKKGFIDKKSHEPRSIRLLLSREELPDLE
jgi:repressor LexA